MQGVLAPGVVPVVLRDSYVGRRSGYLEFTHGYEILGLRFVRGHVVHGASTQPDHWLGEVLVRRGSLTAAQRDEARQMVLPEGCRVGDLLVQRGWLTADDITAALVEHARLLLGWLFAWREGTWVFEEAEDEGEGGLHVSTAEVVVEAVRAVPDRGSVLFALGDLDRVLLLSSDPLVRFQRISLSPVDGFVLSRVDGTQSAREILDTSGLRPEDVERSLFALVATGMLEWAEPKRTPRTGSASLRQEILHFAQAMPARTHFEVLGVPSTAGEAPIKAAYLRLAKRYHPDARHEPGLADLGPVFEAVFGRITQAHQVLSNPVTRAAYLERYAPRPVPPPPPVPPMPGPAPAPLLRGPSAEDVFREAEAHYREGRVEEAIRLLPEVVELADGRLRESARLLLARAYLRQPEWEKLAEQQLKALLVESPGHVDGLCLLAGFYRDRGLAARAAGLWRRVLAVAPDHREAIAELGTPTPPPGTLRNFLRRR